MSDNNKDLLVSIPTRSRPNQLQRTLEMLYSTCASRDNFIIQVIIDSDQIDLYQYVIDMYPKGIEWAFVEHLENSFSNIYEAQRALLALTQAYFFMNLCDDVYGLSQNWDRDIISTKKFFNDDIFALYTSTPIWERSVETHAKCYTESHQPNRKFTLYDDLIWCYCEVLPVITRKLLEFTFPLIQDREKYPFHRDAMVPAIIRFLYSEYGEARNVLCAYTYERITNDQKSTSPEMADCWRKLQERRYDDIKRVAAQVYEYIKNRRQKKLTQERMDAMQKAREALQSGKAFSENNPDVAAACDALVSSIDQAMAELCRIEVADRYEMLTRFE
jgi:hypothetical protein